MLRKVAGVTVQAENGRHYACAHYPSSTHQHGFWKCGCCRRGYVKPVPGFTCPTCQATVDSAFVWKADDSGSYKLAALLEAAEKDMESGSTPPPSQI